MNKITELASRAFRKGEVWRLSNSRVEVDKEKVRLYLFNNLIAIRDNKEEYTYITITTAGYNTLTTRRRLNGLPSIETWVKKRELYLNGVIWSGNWVNVDMISGQLSYNHKGLITN